MTYYSNDRNYMSTKTLIHNTYEIIRDKGFSWSNREHTSLINENRGIKLSVIIYGTMPRLQIFVKNYKGRYVFTNYLDNVDDIDKYVGATSEEVKQYKSNCRKLVLFDWIPSYVDDHGFTSVISSISSIKFSNFIEINGHKIKDCANNINVADPYLLFTATYTTPNGHKTFSTTGNIIVDMKFEGYCFADSKNMIDNSRTARFSLLDKTIIMDVFNRALSVFDKS